MGGGSEAPKQSSAAKEATASQSALLSQEKVRLEQLQAELYKANPAVWQILGIDPQTGQPISATQRPTAPTAVKDPGTQEDYFTVDKGRGDIQKNRVATGKRTGEGGVEVRAPNASEIAKYNAAKAEYAKYQVAQKQYDQWQPNSAQALPDPNAGRMTEQQTINDILAGKTTGAEASKLGQTQAQGAVLGQLLQRTQDNLGGKSQFQAPMDTLMAQYQHRLTGDTQQAPLIQGFADRLQRGLDGNTPVNPQIARELQMQEQAMRTRLQKQLGPGAETSSAGIETLGDFGRQRAGVIDTLNQQDIAQALQGYAGMEQVQSGLTQEKLQQYLSLYGTQQSQLGSDIATYANFAGTTEQQRSQQYANEMNRRTQLADLFTGTSTQPLTGVSFGQLASQYGTMAAQQPMQAAGGGGGFAQYAAPAGMIIGGIAGSIIPGAGTMAGAAIGGMIGGAAGGGLSAAGYGSMMPGGGGGAATAASSNPFTPTSGMNSSSGYGLGSMSSSSMNASAQAPTMSSYLQSKGYY